MIGLNMRLLREGCWVCFVCVCTIYISGIANAKTLMNTDAVDTYYEQKDGEPLWVKNARITKDAADIIGVLAQSWMNGLNPEKYHLKQIQEILSGGSETHPENLTTLEYLITDAYVEYTRDMTGMRITASDMSMRADHWNQRMSAQEALSYLDVNKDSVAEFMLMLEPQTATYQRLKKQLIDYVEQEQKSKEHVDKISFKGIARPGRGYTEIPKLRKRLGLDTVDGADQYKYDDDLFQAVKYFQQEKGLKPDGLIGKQTLYALNQTRLHKIRKIMVNMERLRWIPKQKPDRFIIVNIPSYTLWAVENKKVKFEMPVIVGRESRKTLSFVSEIHGVRFNPTWTVPKTIMREDIWPKLQEDPQYIRGKGIELFDGYDKESLTLDPASVDWQNIKLEELYDFKMLQKPGINNPLGTIRVLMPNSHNIYLHDTNDKSLFYKANKAQSSGCVRMQDPEKVADFIMNTKSNWSKKKLKTILQSGEMKDIYTSERMPVYILYQTAWINADNKITYGLDIYNYDKQLLQLLEKLDEIPKFSDNKISLISAYR